MRQLVAHTRKATHGTVNVENAHPFEIEGIIGAHNGMVFNHESLNKDYQRSFEVDSMHIFAHISEGRPLSEIRSYGAIEYIKKDEPEKIYLGRFNVGELSAYGIGSFDKDDSSKCLGVIWSSQEKPIIKAMGLAGIKGFRFEVKDDTLYYIRNGNLWYAYKSLFFSRTTYVVDDSYKSSYWKGHGTGYDYSKSYNSGHNYSHTNQGGTVIRYDNNRNLMLPGAQERFDLEDEGDGEETEGSLAQFALKGERAELWQNLRRWYGLTSDQLAFYILFQEHHQLTDEEIEDRILEDFGLIEEMPEETEEESEEESEERSEENIKLDIGKGNVDEGELDLGEIAFELGEGD